MDRRIAQLQLTVRHRHGDGSWGSMESVGRAHHDPAQHDPERDWGKGRLFRCTGCDEEIVVDAGPERPFDEDRP